MVTPVDDTMPLLLPLVVPELLPLLLPPVPELEPLLDVPLPELEPLLLLPPPLLPAPELELLVPPLLLPSPVPVPESLPDPPQPSATSIAVTQTAVLMSRMSGMSRNDVLPSRV